ncbi:hypothetical protein Tco_0912143 [Tanacetum coccineum]
MLLLTALAPAPAPALALALALALATASATCDLKVQSRGSDFDIPVVFSLILLCFGIRYSDLIVKTYSPHLVPNSALVTTAMLPLISEPLTLKLCYDPFEMNFDMTLL